MNCNADSSCTGNVLEWVQVEYKAKVSLADQLSWAMHCRARQYGLYCNHLLLTRSTNDSAYVAAWACSHPSDWCCRIFTTDAESMDALRGEIEEHDTGWVVRLRGLPFSASADEVLEFFDGLEVVGGAEGVVFIWGRDRRPLGEAYVEFPSEEVQQEAMKRDRNKMGPRYIEIFKSTKADMSAVGPGFLWPKDARSCLTYTNSAISACLTDYVDLLLLTSLSVLLGDLHGLSIAIAIS